MPLKSRQKGSGRKPLSVSNGEHKQNGTLDSYFPPSPPGNNNEADVNLTTGHLCEQPITVIKNGSLTREHALLTPEDSPVKTQPEDIKTEPVTNYPPIKNYNQKHVENSSEVFGPEPSTSHSNTSSIGSAVENITPLTPKEPTKPKSRKARRPKVKKEEAKPNQKITEFFPVRKSSRKTAKELQREQEETWRNKILDHCEEGLQIVNYDGKGRGIQAMKSFSKGDFIVEYAGDLVELSEAKSREEIYKKDTSYGCYMYFFNHKGRSYCVDATLESGKLGRLLNHSRLKPNCVTKTIDIGDIPYLILVAARDIDVGEELLYDYGDRSKQALESNPWLKE